MRVRFQAVAALGAVLVVAAGSGLIGAGAAPASGPRVVFRIADPRIDEASGLAVGRTSPGIDYVQNDSGDVNRFFALDARTGATAATVTVTGAGNVDWEDIAVAPDPAGISSVWLADIGDNQAERAEIRIYRVTEPRIARTDRGRTIRSSPAAVWRLRYPGGPADAESMAVTPSGTAYLVTKSFLGSSSVYRLPSRPDRRRVQVLRKVGRIDFGPTATANPFGAIGQLTATGASISADGAVLAVRTYADAYVWRLRHGNVVTALTGRPVRVPLPRQVQGEGIAVTSGSLLIDSEGRDQPVYAVPLPRLPAPATSATPTRSPGSVASPIPSGAGDGISRGWLGAGLSAAVGLVAIAIWFVRGRIRACRSPRSTARWP